MKFLRHIVTGLATTSLLALVLVWRLDTLLRNPKTLSSTLQSANVYSAIADELSSQATQVVNQNGLTDPVIKSAIQKGITGDELKTAVEPALKTFSTWLTGSSTASVPNVTLDLRDFKQHLNANLTTSLGAIQAQAVENQLSNQIPDSVDVFKNNAAAQPGQNPPDSPKASLSKIKQHYQSYRNILPLLLFSSTGLLLLLVMLNLGSAKRRLTGPAKPMVFAGSLGLIIGLVVPFLLGSTVLAASDKPNINFDNLGKNIAGGLVKQIFADTRLWYGAMLGVGIILIVAGHVLGRREAKDKKKK